MTENIVTRRNILKAGAVAAGALALGTLSGCSSNDSENNDANQVSIPDSGILPLGSVVQLKAFEGTELKHVVICRRPKVSSGRELNSDGSISETTERKYLITVSSNIRLVSILIYQMLEEILKQSSLRQT